MRRPAKEVSTVIRKADARILLDLPQSSRSLVFRFRHGRFAVTLCHPGMTTFSGFGYDHPSLPQQDRDDLL